jgi:hypothetical protein
MRATEADATCDGATMLGCQQQFLAYQGRTGAVRLDHLLGAPLRSEQADCDAIHLKET